MAAFFNMNRFLGLMNIFNAFTMIDLVSGVLFKESILIMAECFYGIDSCSPVCGVNTGQRAYQNCKYH